MYAQYFYFVVIMMDWKKTYLDWEWIRILKVGLQRFIDEINYTLNKYDELRLVSTRITHRGCDSRNYRVTLWESDETVKNFNLITYFLPFSQPTEWIVVHMDFNVYIRQFFFKFFMLYIYNFVFYFIEYWERKINEKTEKNKKVVCYVQDPFEA